ncbi:MAG: acyloxyacyl hydrolase [Moritella sp.]|uniref:acyloxyacyl hydrolase n=1 Tax=Moritella sp. TaxID=78556 RepID=UPI000C0C7C9A|nr:acyloxyacyl hydrolase [Moritella sp.]MBL1418255.1 acyloxyacyl hydrolase [Moritella sp.]
MMTCRFGLLCLILLITVNSVNAASEMDDPETRLPFIAEFRVGILAHNIGPIASREENGTDVNMEIHFQPPKLLRALGEPKPFIGTTINTVGDTSFLYAGFMWDFDITAYFFASLGLGMAVHNGNSGVVEEDDGLTTLGCWWLFRESLELGYKVEKQISIALFWDHVSHGDFCSDRNSGMDNTGLRLHFKF